MKEPLRCTLHPEAVAEGPCLRCGQPFCALCLRPWHESHICSPCQGSVRRRRLKIVAVVSLMVSAPAFGIAWGVHQRLSQTQRRSSGAAASQPSRGTTERAAQAEAQLREAELLARSGRTREARTHLGRLLADRPDHPGALHALARLAWEAGEHQEVLRLTTRLVTIHPAAALARQWQAEAHLALGQPLLAEETLRQGVKAAPRSGRLTLALVDLLLKLEKRQEALSVLRAALLARPDSEEAAIRARLRALE